MASKTKTKVEKALIPKDIEISDKYQDLFPVYALWRSLPRSILKQVSQEELIDRFGFDDPQVLDLVQLHTQGDFADKYGININTLTDWNKKLNENDPLAEARGWALGLTKNVVLSMYNHAVRKGNAELYKLFFKVVNEWQEKIKIDPVKGTIIFEFEAIDREVEPETLSDNQTDEDATDTGGAEDQGQTQ